MAELDTLIRKNRERRRKEAESGESGGGEWGFNEREGEDIEEARFRIIIEERDDNS
ncbi:uncharacterized protein DS421_15g504590 [Arachis hypogaea]|nr:uncharacterized protein DS421_15g504590 [Arachis hypogaea]